ncbi:MAG: hypothetical protein JW987_11000 [Anaerolineaceae bacterium]|nr:hypothetical protein [Anaerolineaceae bacterium]
MIIYTLFLTAIFIIATVLFVLVVNVVDPGYAQKEHVELTAGLMLDRVKLGVVSGFLTGLTVGFFNWLMDARLSKIQKRGGSS